MTEPDVPLEVLDAFGCVGARPRLLAGGVMNANWRVDGPGGPMVIRRHSVTRSIEDVSWEHALIAFADDRAWPVPTPVASLRGSTSVEERGRLWSASQLLEGEPLREDSTAMRRISCRLLGRLHRDLAGFGSEGQRPGFGKTWELDLAVESAGADTFNEVVVAFSRDYPDLGAAVRRQRYRSLRELSRLHYPDLPEHPIHGDFQPKNLLFRDGNLSAILDFDQARRDALVCDLAPLLMPFQPLDLRLGAALLEGYESVRPLSESEWSLLPALVRASLLWWVTLLLVRWRTEGGDTAGIVRTMNQRFPAFDAAERGFRALRR